MTRILLQISWPAAASSAAGTSRKISVFSFKEIERSLLLEDFQRKYEIVYFGASGPGQKEGKVSYLPKFFMILVIFPLFGFFLLKKCMIWLFFIVISSLRLESHLARTFSFEIDTIRNIGSVNFPVWGHFQAIWREF